MHPVKSNLATSITNNDSVFRFSGFKVTYYWIQEDLCWCVSQAYQEFYICLTIDFLSQKEHKQSS